jgi:hypothetical protein
LYLIVGATCTTAVLLPWLKQPGKLAWNFKRRRENNGAFRGN